MHYWLYAVTQEKLKTTSDNLFLMNLRICKVMEKTMLPNCQMRRQNMTLRFTISCYDSKQEQMGTWYIQKMLPWKWTRLSGRCANHTSLTDPSAHLTKHPCQNKKISLSKHTWFSSCKLTLGFSLTPTTQKGITVIIILLVNVTFMQ